MKWSKVASETVKEERFWASNRDWAVCSTADGGGAGRCGQEELRNSLGRWAITCSNSSSFGGELCWWAANIHDSNKATGTRLFVHSSSWSFIFLITITINVSWCFIFLIVRSLSFSETKQSTRDHVHDKRTKHVRFFCLIINSKTIWTESNQFSKSNTNALCVFACSPTFLHSIHFAFKSKFNLIGCVNHVAQFDSSSCSSSSQLHTCCSLNNELSSPFQIKTVNHSPLVPSNSFHNQFDAIFFATFCLPKWKTAMESYANEYRYSRINQEFDWTSHVKHVCKCRQRNWPHPHSFLDRSGHLASENWRKNYNNDKLEF